MDTKSKRYLNRSQNTARVPRHYSHIIEDTPAVNIGLGIVIILVLFLLIVVLSAFI